MPTTKKARAKLKSTAPGETNIPQTLENNAAPEGRSRPMPKGKLGIIANLIARPEGARIDELMRATGWQTHSVRGALAGALKKKHGLKIVSARIDKTRVYSMQSEAA